MIVACQKCRTRFQLDEARIPAKGVRVRCSKCKHAFFVAPPATGDQTVHRLAEQAAATGRPAKPDATFDLPDPELTTPPRGAAAHDPEDDWQFNLDPPDGSDARDATPPPAEITDSEPTTSEAESFFELDGLPDPTIEPEPALEPPPKPAKAKAGKSREKEERSRAPSPIAPEEEVSFEDLGNRDGLDLGLPEKSAPPAPPKAAKAAKAAKVEAAKPERAARPEKAAKARKPADAATSPSAPKAEVEPAPAMRRAERASPLPARIAGTAGWIGAAVLFAFGLRGPLAAAPAPRVLTPSAVGALELSDVRVRHLENLWTGPLVVISGELRNPGAAPARAGVVPLVRVVDAHGEALPVEPAWIGEALPDVSLRGTEPEQLARLLNRSARELGERSFAAQEKIAVQAVLAAPSGAADFRVETQALAGIPDPAGEAPDASDVAPTRAPATDTAAGTEAAPTGDSAAPTSAAAGEPQPDATQLDTKQPSDAGADGAAPPAPQN